MHRRLVYFLCFILVISSAAQAHRITIPADVFKAGETICFFNDLIFPQGPVRALVDTGFAARIRLPKDVAGKLNLPDQGLAFQKGGLTVGSGKQYSTIAAAVTAAHNGDTINVDAGTYTNDYASINKNITLQSAGGIVKLVSTGLIPNGKAIFIVNGDVTINNFEFAGAKVADNNGEGIRFESGNLILNDCYFHHNQEGILTGSKGTLTINNSEFAYNGTGDGQTHNLYAGKLASLTINNSYFHDAIEGHEIKSRALNTTITNSRIYDLNSTASYSIDLPNGGNSLIQNNVIEQGPQSHNFVIIAYGEEGNLNSGTNFLVSNNTILNEKSGSALAVWNRTRTVTAQITSNKFFGLTSNQIASGPNFQSGNRFLVTEPSLDTAHP